MAYDRTQLIRLGAIALATGATLSALAGAAGAATPGSSGNNGAGAVPTTLDGIKAKAATDITDRVNDLNAAIAKVNAAKGLGASQATLVSYLGTDVAPLQQLNQTIHGDSTLQQAAHDFGTIFSGYRVYRLVLPAARIAAVADEATTSAIPNLTTDAAKAQARVNPGQPGHAAAPRQRPRQPDQQRDQRHQRARRRGAGLHAGAVERRHRAPARAGSSDQTATAALQKGASRPQADRAGPRGRSRAPQLHHDHDELTPKRGTTRPRSGAGWRATTGASRCWRSARWPPSSGARPGTRRTRPVPTARSPRRYRST